MLLDEKKEAERKEKKREYNRRYQAKVKSKVKKGVRKYVKRTVVAPQVFEAIIYLRHAKRAIMKQGMKNISRSDLLVLLALDALQTRE